MMDKIVLLFDIDGTLLHCGNAPAQANDEAFYQTIYTECNAAGVQKSGRTDYAIVQDIAIASIGRSLQEQEIENLFTRYLQLLPSKLAMEDGFYKCAGVDPLLAELATYPNILLGVQTGNVEGAAKLKLEKAQLVDYFSFGGFCQRDIHRCDILHRAIDQIARKHSGVSNDQIFVIGDTPFDIQSANEIGVKSIGVATGVFSMTELSQANPTHCFLSLEAKDDFLQAIAIFGHR